MLLPKAVNHLLHLLNFICRELLAFGKCGQKSWNRTGKFLLDQFLNFSCLYLLLGYQRRNNRIFILYKLAPESTASLQKDLEKGHNSEVQGLLFDVIQLGEEKGIDMQTYQTVAAKFK